VVESDAVRSNHRGKERRVRRLAFIVALCAAALSITSFATAAGGKLRCFADSPASCVLSSATAATLDTTGGGDAGVFLTNGKSTNGTSLQNVDFSFAYSCSTATDFTSCVGGGAPRWAIPIDTNGNSKTTEGYAALDANGCGDTGTVNTALATCAVNFLSVDYANWDAFAAAHPTYTISSALPFVISDAQTSGPIHISNVRVTK
jgi:hypothetical protein